MSMLGRTYVIYSNRIYLVVDLLTFSLLYVILVFCTIVYISKFRVLLNYDQFKLTIF